ncbi:YhgE/Pip domain-containing protein [Priestia filamentosa]|uniref:YhgE/Pip domain-containing protein n=1 Tax=Priestia filamentosa TaxID=1402861 RepID=UPI003982D15E
MLKNKLLFISPLVVLLVIALFGLTLIPSVQQKPKNLPIALVNEDIGVVIPPQGKVNMGNTVTNMLKKNITSTDGEDPPVKWINVKSKEDVLKGLDNQEYYGALIIPKDFSQKQSSLMTSKPDKPEINIFINQGMNPIAANLTGQMLNTMGDNLENGIQTQVLQRLAKQNVSLKANQLTVLTDPVQVNVKNVNEVGTASMNGSAPVALFQPLWMSSIAGAVVLFFVANKLAFVNRKQKLYAVLTQVLAGTVLSLVAGFGLTWIADLLGIYISNFMDISLFLIITYFAFFLLITAVLSWLEMKGIPLFVLILFFGAPLLSMAPEMMSTFYRDYIYSWLPMRFMVEGLRELFFFHRGFSFSGPASVLLWIALGSFLIIILSVLKVQSSASDKGSYGEVEARSTKG